MYIKIKVKTNQRKESVDKLSEDTFLVSTKAKAERNMANIRTIDLLSDFLKIDKSKIKIVTGHHQPSKIFLIE